MGNTQTVCKNPCTQQPEILVETGERFDIKKFYDLEPILFEPPLKEKQDASLIENEKNQIKITETPMKVRFQADGPSTGKTKASAVKVLELNFASMIVVGNNPNVSNNNDKMIEVPYTVIRLTLTDELKKTIKDFGEEIFKKYDQQKNFTQHWKLHKKGFYIIQLGESLFGLLTANSYFEGYLLQQGDQMIPQNDGIYITQDGIYRGSFERGKATGKGIYKNRQTKTTFKGTWEKGVMVQGIIQNAEIKYEGPFKEGVSHGKGKLRFKERQYTYKGEFQDGVCHDREGFLESEFYIYEGGFQNGRKQGWGCLVQKEKPQKDKKVKYKPAEQFQGNWHKDSFQGVKSRN